MKSLNPKISVIVPLYNQGQYLEECLVSISKSDTPPEYEVVVVDDASTDNSLDVATKLQKKFGFRLVNNPNNIGLPATRNVGIENSRGEYILPLDADDKVSSKALWKMYECIDDELGDFIYCDAIAFGEEKGTIEYPNFLIDYFKRGNFIPSFSLFRKSDWEDVGGYDEKMREGYEDWEFYLRLALNGRFGYHISEPLFYYRQKKKSMIKDARANHDKLFKYIKEKHGGFYG